LLFRSESEIDAWRRRHGRKRGAVLKLSQVWELAKRWYQDRMAPDFRGRTAAEAQAIFRALGLNEEFWLAPPA